MARSPDDDGADDDDLWRRITGSVRPLKRKAERFRPQSASLKPMTPPAAGTQRRVKPRTGPAPQRLSPPPPAPPLAPGTTSGLDKRNATRLRRGRLPVDGRLDLHGMTRAEAHAAFNRFIAASAGEGRRCVLVITGKGLRGGGGAGILRAELPHWLNAPAVREHVVAFTPAQPKDGGGGAFYLYLRRKRDK